MATSNRASIKLYRVEGIARKAGNDAKDGTGCTWLQQFYGEMESSAIDAYYNSWEHVGDLSKLTDKQVRRAIAPFFDTCCICHKHINSDAWLNLDGGEMACNSHVKVMTRQ